MLRACSNEMVIARPTKREIKIIANQRKEIELEM